jgi:hypothetical protein
MEVVKDPAVFERMKDIYEIQDIELLGNELEVIGKQIDRNPNLKFSKSSAPKTITKFSISELVSNDLFREKFINSSEDIQKQLNEIKENPKNRIFDLDDYFIDVVSEINEILPNSNVLEDYNRFKNDIENIVNNYINSKNKIHPLFESIKVYIDDKALPKQLEKIVGLEKVPSVKSLVGKRNEFIESVENIIIDIFKEMGLKQTKNFVANMKDAMWEGQEVKILTTIAEIKEKFGSKASDRWSGSKGTINAKSPKYLMMDYKKTKAVSDQKFIDNLKNVDENSKVTAESLLLFLEKVKNHEEFEGKLSNDAKNKLLAITYWLSSAGGMQSVVRTSYGVGKVQESVFTILENARKKKTKEELREFFDFDNNKNILNQIVIEHRPPANLLSKKIAEFLFDKDSDINNVKDFIEYKAKINIVDKPFDNAINNHYMSTESIGDDYNNPYVKLDYINELTDLGVEQKSISNLNFTNLERLESKDNKKRFFIKIPLNKKQLTSQVKELDKVKEDQLKKLGYLILMIL